MSARWDALTDRLGRRPWPPPPETPLGRAALTTLDRLLFEYGADVPAGLPSPERWLVVASAELAAELKAAPLPGHVLVATDAEWAELLDPHDGPPTPAGTVVVRLGDAGPPERWIHLLPPGAAAESALARGPGTLDAVHATLWWADLGTLEVLHVWVRGGDTPTLVEGVSGVLRVAPGGPGGPSAGHGGPAR